MTARREYQFVLAGLAALMSWITVWSWADLIEEPSRYFGPALTGAVIIALTGALLRSVRTPWWAVLAVQLVVITSWFHHRQRADDLVGGWVPTPDGLSVLAEQVRAGAAQVNRYAAPVSVEQAQAPIYLLVTALVVVLIVDLIGCGLQRAPWSGLPVLVALTVPISVLDTPLPMLPLAGVVGLYLALIAYARSEEVLSWGQGAPQTRREERRAGLIGAGPAAAIGVVTTLAALTLPAFVPVTTGLFNGGNGRGSGDGAGSITLTNPLVNLRRDLEQNENIPVLDVSTNASDPTYLRMTVLDRFDGRSWIPGAREFPVENRADGPIPDPDGITRNTPGTESFWTLRTENTFFTSWLPVPFPTRSLSIREGEGDWRYDSSTLDIAIADKLAPSGVQYTATGFAPVYDPADLDAAGTAPAALRSPMTRVPQLDPVVTAIARDVTNGAQTDYEKAVLLQRWFRSEGGFAYSLEPAGGEGMSQLVRFLTTEKIGYCEQFAASMAVMARALGIPARVVVGFLQPEEVVPGTFRFTSSDLHAWPEIYFAGSGWVRFEPTPASRTGAPPPWSRADIPAPAPITPSASPTAALPTPTTAPQRPETSTEVTESSSRAPIAIAVLVVVVVVLLLVLPSLVRRSRRRQRLAVRDDVRAEVESLWRELRATAIDLRIAWPDGRSVRAVARTLKATRSATADDHLLLDALVELVERARYRRTFVLDGQDRAVAHEAIARWSALMADSVPRRRARRARWFPRSVFIRDRSGDHVVATSTDEARDLTGVS